MKTRRVTIESVSEAETSTAPVLRKKGNIPVKSQLLRRQYCLHRKTDVKALSWEGKLKAPVPHKPNPGPC